MKRHNINSRLIFRYSLFQIPSLVVITLVVFLIDQWYELSFLIKISAIFGWIVKDIILFPFVKRAYSIKERDKSKMLLNEKGIAVETINPKGYVRINGELWKAELSNINDPIFKNDPIEITEICGLKLKVKKISSSKID